MVFQKVRPAPSVPGLLFFAAGALVLTACEAQGPSKEPAAEVVLTDEVAEQPSDGDEIDTNEAPGFASVAEAPKPAASVALPAPDGEQLVSGTIIDFLCNPDSPVSSDDTAPTPACDLIIRTKTRGDRRMLCNVAPCDAWAARGSLPQGIRGLGAEAWVTLADSYDASGNPTGRIAKVTRLNVIYSKAP